MKVWYLFEVCIFFMEWGIKVFMVLLIFMDLVEKVGLKYGVCVEIEIKDYVFNFVVISVLVIDQFFLYIGKKFMVEVGVVL